MRDHTFTRKLGQTRHAAGAGTLMLAIVATASASSPFATRVVEYQPAPGQFINNPDFNDPARALGPPQGGGTTAPDNTKVVTLGGFGGSITLAFDQPILDQPASNLNPLGLDAIVFGNAFFVGSTPARRWAEAGVIEISRDDNLNGLPDDPWFVIPGTHLGTVPAARRLTVTYSDTNAGLPPVNKSWIPSSRAGQTWSVTAYALPLDIFTGPVVVNPLGLSAPTWGTAGYADSSPTLILGDLDGDNLIDDPNLAPEDFYTRPSDPAALDTTPGSGGGDAFDLAWAVDPESGQPATLDRFDFIRITSAVNAVRGLFGEASVEIAGVAAVRTRDARDYNLDTAVNLDDLSDFITDFYTVPTIPAGLQPDAPTLADITFTRPPCPDAPDAPPPYAADAYRALGYRAGFAINGNDPCPALGPNLENLSDFITAFYTQ